ncbi:MAG: hypothetical protein JXN59_18625, partial [Anaerolineae bacterium]|nr:hypothetical protein [Anaerolineae bacterium]
MPADQVEADFEKLIKLLTIREEAITHMTELAIQAERDIAKPEETRDLEAEKAETITLCQNRIDAAVHLYGEGRISREEYLRRVEKNEREIAHWESRTTQTERIALELMTCIEAVNQMHKVWETASDDEKKDMAQHLFTGLLYNIDTRRFEGFSLKPWADRFLVIRMDLYYQMFGEFEGEKENSTPVLGEWNPVPHRGLFDRGFHRVPEAVDYGLRLVYWGSPLPQTPVTDGILSKIERNDQLRDADLNGIFVTTL